MHISTDEHGMKTINSGLPEFGYELIATLPYAYYLKSQGRLKKTVSGFDTKPLYFFSENHEEIPGKRSWDNVESLSREKFPNIEIHNNKLDWEKFLPPPLKLFYSEKAIKFEKPTLVITNRINSEWGGEPINFIDHDTLNLIISELCCRYQIVYIDTAHFGENYEDHASFIKTNLNQINLSENGVLTLADLRKKHPELSVNEIQCRLYAGCDKFITSNGGLGILCSYFGGEVLIFSKLCRELDPDINSFCHWYPKFNKASITVISAEDELISAVRSRWLNNDPLINILIRTSNRPNYFHDCIKSIYNQTYKNINIVVGIDNEFSRNYVQGHKCTVVEYKKNEDKPIKPPKSDAYGDWFPFNEYFNSLLAYASTGYVIYLDDDDCLYSDDVLEKLALQIKKNKPQLIFWRVKFPNRLVPSDSNWNNRVPVCRDMSTIGYCHDVKIKPIWEPWKRGDYRVANYLFNNAKGILWINEIFTCLQRAVEDGWGQGDDKESINKTGEPPLVVIIPPSRNLISPEKDIDSLLEAVSNYSKSSMIYVGVSGESRSSASLLTRKYSSNVRFFIQKKDYSRSVLVNSILAKIKRRDSVVFFAMPNVRYPRMFFKEHIQFFVESTRNKSGVAHIYYPMLIDISKDDLQPIRSSSERDFKELKSLLINKNYPAAAYKLFADFIQNDNFRSLGFARALVKLQNIHIKYRHEPSTPMMRVEIENPNCFFCDFLSFEQSQLFYKRWLEHDSIGNNEFSDKIIKLSNSSGIPCWFDINQDEVRSEASLRIECLAKPANSKVTAFKSPQISKINMIM